MILIIEKITIDMEVRNIRETDFMACVNIIKSSWPTFKERESIYHLFSKYFYNTSLVAENDGDLVSFLLGFLSQVDSTTAYIHLVSTDPRFQGLGIASKLYEKFFDIVKKMGRTRVCLIVNPDNTQSIEFHKKLGFHTSNKGEIVNVDGIEAVRDYNGPGNPMVMFVRDL